MIPSGGTKQKDRSRGKIDQCVRQTERERCNVKTRIRRDVAGEEYNINEVKHAKIHNSKVRKGKRLLLKMAVLKIYLRRNTLEII